jgi:hypothetical protein
VQVAAAARPRTCTLCDKMQVIGSVMIGNHKAIDRTRLMDVLPVVRAWQANGAVGGLRRHLHAWRDGELLAARERRQYRDLIKTGYDATSGRTRHRSGSSCRPSRQRANAGPSLSHRPALGR